MTPIQPGKLFTKSGPCLDLRWRLHVAGRFAQRPIDDRLVSTRESFGVMKHAPCGNGFHLRGSCPWHMEVLSNKSILKIGVGVSNADASPLSCSGPFPLSEAQPFYAPLGVWLSERTFPAIHTACIRLWPRGYPSQLPVLLKAMSLLRQCLGQLGATPADASKVTMPAEKAEADPADKYF
jgi:hypothetical protein